MDISQMDEYLTFKEASELAGVTAATIHMWNRLGQIHAIRFKGIWLTTKPELRRAIEQVGVLGTGRPRIGTPSPELMGAADELAAG